MNSLPNKSPPETSLPADTVELIEFGDFACNRCRQTRRLLNRVLNAFEGQVTYSFYHFPKHRSESSNLAALAAEAARRQGHFWPMFQALFEQPTISCTTLSVVAIYLGLNYRQFLEDLEDDQLRHRIEADQQAGYRYGITKTPTLFVGGQQFHGKLTESRLTSVIRSHLSRCTRPLLSKVDLVSGTIYWGRE